MVSILLGEQRYFEETLPISELRDLLDAGSMSSARGQAERIRGLKWLLAMISKGTDVSRFFPDVIRNIMTPNLELKKLVYMYVLHYADHDETSRAAALLSINAFQRDLNDDHELIRGLALRTLTSVAVEDVHAVQALAVRTCARDISPYVRKIAANAVTKVCLNLSPKSDLRETFEDEVLAKLLMDASPSVMGSAASAMIEICPERYDIINMAFDRTINALPEVDEWGQISILKLLERFARNSFTDPVLPDDEFEDGVDDGPDKNHLSDARFNSRSPSLRLAEEELDSTMPIKRKWQGVVLAPVSISTASIPKRKLPTKSELDSFLEDDTPVIPEFEPSKTTTPEPKTIKETGTRSEIGSSINAEKQKPPMHEKHKRLLRAALPLLKSRNSGVVIAAASVMWYCGQRSKNAMHRVAQAMIRLVRSQHREVRYCALKAVLPLIVAKAGPFAPHMADFFVNPASDAPFVRKLKLEIMCRLVRERTLSMVLRELETYVAHSNDSFASQAVRTVGRIALQNKRSVARDCLLGLAGYIQSDACSKRVLEESLVVIRDVFHHLGPNLDAEELVVLREVLCSFDRIPQNLSRARVSLLWLCRAYYNDIPDEAGDILRAVAASFADEDAEVKIQALSLASLANQSESQLSAYVLELGSFDNFFDVRDWARFLSKGATSLIPSDSGIDSNPMSPENIELHPSENFEINTLSFLVGAAVLGYSPLPPWAEQVRLSYRARRSSSSSGSSSEEEESSSENESEESGDEEEEEETDGSEEDGKAEVEQVNLASVNGNITKTIRNPETGSSAEPPKSTPPIVPSPNAPQVAVQSPVSIKYSRVPEFSNVLSHVRGQGLQMDVWLSRETVPADKTGFTPVLLRFANKLDDRPLTRIKVEPSDAVIPLSDPIGSLDPGFHRDDCRVLVKFGGHWRTPVKVTVSTEETGKINTELKASAGELLVPDSSLSLDDFGRLKKQLAGMNETSASFTNPKGYDVQKRVLEVANFHTLSSPETACLTDSLTFRFASKRTDTAATKVLLEILVALDGTLNVSLHCEYALAGQALMDELKASFMQ